MATHYKLTEDDEGFLNVPQGAAMVSSGTNGTESWLEREREATVRIQISTVAVAPGDGATLEAVIEVDGAAAKAQDGPRSADTHMQAVQSIQVVVKPGERLSFKAYPTAMNARVLKTVVHTADMK